VRICEPQIVLILQIYSGYTYSIDILAVLKNRLVHIDSMIRTRLKAMESIVLGAFYKF